MSNGPAEPVAEDAALERGERATVPFNPSLTGKNVIKLINDYGDEVLKVFNF